MKKFLIIISLIFILFVLVMILLHYFMPSGEPTLMDCLEFGYCKEGTKIIDNGVEVIVNKEYCLKYHYKWDDKNKMGLLHKTTD